MGTWSEPVEGREASHLLTRGRGGPYLLVVFLFSFFFFLFFFCNHAFIVF